jgi:hypothetical protein
MIGLLVTFYLAALAYTKISGKTVSNLLSITEINSSIQSKIGGWIILLPIVDLCILLYNVIATSLWFIGIVLQFLASLLKWIWKEVIIAGGFFILQILFHYIILWPWKILLISFSKILPSIRVKYLWIGSISIFTSLFIMFLGRYLVEILEWWVFLKYLFAVLAIIPIGTGLSWIIQSTQNDNREKIKKGTYKFLTHLIYIIFAFIFLGITEFTVIYLSTHSSLSSILSTLAAGGNLLGSFLILINSVVIIFSFAVLPSFSYHYEGANNKVIVSFFQYLLRNNWAKYVIAIPTLIIPIIITCTIPYVLTQGVSHLAGKVSDAVFEFRITQLEKTKANIPAFNYESWLDPEKISNDSLKLLQEKDVKRLEASLGTIITKKNQIYLQNFYTAHSSQVGALPVGALAYLSEQFFKIENNVISTLPMNSIEGSIDTSSLNQLRNQKIPTIQQKQKNISDQIKAFNERLNAVCNEESQTTKQNINKNASQNLTSDPTAKENTIQLDGCESEREYWREQITNTNKEKIVIEKEMARAQLIVDHLKNIYSLEKTYYSSNNLSGKIAYLLVSIWLCLLIAVSFSPLIPLFAFVNHHIYTNEGDGGELYLIERIKSANKENVNQPLLGIILFLFLAFWQVSNFIPFLETLKNFIPSLPKIELLLQEKTPFFSNNENIETSNKELIQDNSSNTENFSMSTTDSSNKEAITIFESKDVDEAAEYAGPTFTYNTSLHTENGAPDTTYEVSISYVIDENGNVTDINPLTNYGYGMEEEIVAAIQKTSGYWKPAKINKEPIKCRLINTFKFGE